jgi:hypothetical protein
MVKPELWISFAGSETRTVVFAQYGFHSQYWALRRGSVVALICCSFRYRIRHRTAVTAQYLGHGFDMAIKRPDTGKGVGNEADRFIYPAK